MTYKCKNCERLFENGLKLENEFGLEEYFCDMECLTIYISKIVQEVSPESS